MCSDIAPLLLLLYIAPFLCCIASFLPLQYIEDFDVNAENEARELRRRNINNLNEEAENLLNDSKSKKEALPPKKINNRKHKNSSHHR